MRLVCEAAPVVKSTGLASVTENNKRECTISQQESALFTFRTMEKKKPFFLRELFALYLKAKKKNEKKTQNKTWTRNIEEWSYKRRKKTTNELRRKTELNETSRRMEELKELFC